jgi:hypothetical protein
MPMKNHGIALCRAMLLYAVLAVVSVFYFLCAPAAPIQSPRIVSTISVSSSAIYSPTKYTLYENGKKTFAYRPYDSRGMVILGNILPVPHLGIAKRIELSGYMLPVLGEYITNYGIGTKVFLFDAGQYTLFRNVAVAVCGNLNKLDGEWDEMEFHQAGLIFGTRIPYEKGELEFVFIPSYFYHSTETHPGEATGIYLHEKGIDNSIGAIYWPFGDKFFQINIGLTARKAFTRETKVTWGTGNIQSRISPFIVQGTMVFNIGEP